MEVITEYWERLKGETSNYYSQFAKYRDLRYEEGERSLLRTAEVLGMSKRSLEKLSVRFHWVDRAEKYDDFIERQIRKANEEEIIQMGKRHADIAVAMQNKALNALQKIDADDLKANDITNMIKTAIDIERTSRGEATEITKTDANVSGEIQVGIYLPDNKR